jgi:uncharacterized protein (TIGR02996 family)
MTTAHDSTGLALLAGIAAEPDEDAPRLVYADYLDEHGDHDRAELIRAQCEAPRHPGTLAKPCGIPACVHPGCALLRRADALLAANEAQWRRGPRCPVCVDGESIVTSGNRCLKCHGTNDAGGLLRRTRDDEVMPGFQSAERWLHRVDFVRGFPHRVTCPRLADALAPVEVSDFTDRGEVVEHDYEATPWLAAVLAAHPTVREVVPRCREPMRLPNSAVAGCPFIWHPMSDGMAEHTLPLAFADLLTGERPRGIPGAVLFYYPTPEAAVAALGVAVAEVARGG